MSTIISGGNAKIRLEKTKFAKSSFGPDVIFLTPEPGDLTIGIDAVRNLIANLSVKSVSNPKKIAIVQEAHLLTEQAQNALLKTLEEPPEEADIFLLAQNLDSFLPTTISRCHVIELPVEFPSIEPLPDITSMNLSQKFQLAAEISKDRLSALAWLDQALFSFHKSRNFHSVRAALAAKRLLSANTNTRLTIENLLLNW